MVGFFILLLVVVILALPLTVLLFATSARSRTLELERRVRALEEEEARGVRRARRSRRRRRWRSLRLQRRPKRILRCSTSRRRRCRSTRHDLSFPRKRGSSRRRHRHRSCRRHRTHLRRPRRPRSRLPHRAPLSTGSGAGVKLAAGLGGLALFRGRAFLVKSPSGTSACPRRAGGARICRRAILGRRGYAVAVARRNHRCHRRAQEAYSQPSAKRPEASRRKRHPTGLRIVGELFAFRRGGQRGQDSFFD